MTKKSCFVLQEFTACVSENICIKTKKQVLVMRWLYELMYNYMNSGTFLFLKTDCQDKIKQTTTMST